MKNRPRSPRSARCGCQINAGKPLDERYFAWLYKKIGAVSNRNPERSHWHLAKRLYTTEFLYFIPNDDNRAMDGLDLRYEFLDRYPTLPHDRAWLELECSFLEMLIALARRADFETDTGALEGGVGGWFWKLMDNVQLSRYTDSVYDERSLEDIDRVLETINNRTYKANGQGGLFPLRRPSRDQRDVELWYQLQAYLLEKKYVRP